MTEKISTSALRAHIGEILNRVALRHDEFIIERKGKPLAALIPIERMEQMREFARQHALEFLKRQMEGPGNRLSEEEVMEIAIQAQRSAREDMRIRDRSLEPAPNQAGAAGRAVGRCLPTPATLSDRRELRVAGRGKGPHVTGSRPRHQ